MDIGRNAYEYAIIIFIYYYNMRSQCIYPIFLLFFLFFFGITEREREREKSISLFDISNAHNGPRHEFRHACTGGNRVLFLYYKY